LLRCRENQMITLISVFVVDQMNQPASVFRKGAPNSKFELDLYEGVRTFIRPVTKREVRRTKRRTYTLREE
jgi:hypothetical protein